MTFNEGEIDWDGGLEFDEGDPAVMIGRISGETKYCVTGYPFRWKARLWAKAELACTTTLEEAIASCEEHEKGLQPF